MGTNVGRRDEWVKEHPPVKVCWPWHLMALGVVGSIVAALLLNFDELPDPIPTHWNVRGEVDQWMDKSFPALLFSLLLGPGIMWLTFLLTALTLTWQSSNLSAPGVSVSEVRRTRTWHVMDRMQVPVARVNFLASTFIALIAALPLAPEQWGPIHELGSSAAVFPLMLVAFLGAIVWLIVSIGRVNVEVNREFPDDQAIPMKWGLFANDPSKPALVDTSGMGSNYTANVARPVGKVLAIGLFGLPLVAVAVLIALAL